MSNIIDLDELSAQELLAVMQKAAADCFPRDRDQFVAACPLSPNNLVGSYFRAPDSRDENAVARWLEGDLSAVAVEGMVVCQPPTPVATVYLVEFFNQRGATGHQRLVDLDEMLEHRWAFFDDRGWFESWQPEGEAPTTAREAVKQEHTKDK